MQIKYNYEVKNDLYLFALYKKRYKNSAKIIYRGKNCNKDNKVILMSEDIITKEERLKNLEKLIFAMRRALDEACSDIDKISVNEGIITMSQSLDEVIVEYMSYKLRDRNDITV